jgi:hypothetical protein
MVTRTALWLIRVAADRWPVEIREELLREWTAEVHTIARDPSLSALQRVRLMLGFSVSLAVARPGGEPALGWKRGAGVVAIASAYLLVLAMIQQGWSWVYQSMNEGERPVIDDSGLWARLVQAAVALLPVLLAAVAGWWLGRRYSDRRVRSTSLGLCLIAVVAACVGLGFLAERLLHEYIAFPTGAPLPPTMSYHFGSQPYGMVTSWVVWLVAFVLLAWVVRRLALKRPVLAVAGVSTLIAGLAVTVATFVQFGPSTAPRTEMWKWFAQWLVPPHPFESAVDTGAASFHSARNIYYFVSSYPHVLLAVAAFGVAFLVANSRQRVLANGLGIDSSSSRV